MAVHGEISWGQNSPLYKAAHWLMRICAAAWSFTQNCTITRSVCAAGSVYLLHMLLKLALSSCLTGRPFLNDLPRSSDFLIGVSSQKHPLIEVPHRQHVLLILPVYGFTVGSKKTSTDAQNSQTSAICGWELKTAKEVLQIKCKRKQWILITIILMFTCYQWSSEDPTVQSNVPHFLSGSDQCKNRKKLETNWNIWSDHREEN